MATLTIRNLDETVKYKLQVRAARNGRSMEAEVRAIVTETVEGAPKPVDSQAGREHNNNMAERNLGLALHRRFRALIEELECGEGQQTSTAKSESWWHRHGKEFVERNGLGTAIQELFAPVGGIEWQIPPRSFTRRPIPTFDE